MTARILVVAGHDPTGGAGVDADRVAALRFGARAECVVTAWTEQDGEHVRAVRPRATADWLEDARYALALPIGALKSGLLPDADAVCALASLLDELERPVPVVVDPVLAASGGEPFLDDAGIEALLAELVPRGVILTPNLPEAARLAGREPAALLDDPEARLACAEILLARGAAAVVLKGGHGREPSVRDLVLERDRAPQWIESARQPARLHGSGCRHASAIAAQLAQGLPLADAARLAAAWLGELLRAAR